MEDPAHAKLAALTREFPSDEDDSDLEGDLGDDLDEYEDDEYEDDEYEDDELDGEFR